MAVRRVGKRRIGAKRLGRRRMPLMRRLPKARQPVQFFKRTLYLPGGWVVQGGAPTIKTYTPVFQLNLLPDYLEFSGLYDQYCIKGIKVQLLNRGNSTDTGINSTTPAITGQSALIASVLDYTDANPLGSFSDASQYESLKMTQGWRGHSRYFVPALQQEVNIGATQIGYAPKKKMWLSTALPSNGVPHFGVKFIADATGIALGNQITFDVKIDYYLAFKNVK